MLCLFVIGSGNEIATDGLGPAAAAAAASEVETTSSAVAATIRHFLLTPDSRHITEHRGVALRHIRQNFHRAPLPSSPLASRFRATVAV